MMRERMSCYARDKEVADKLREKINTLPDPCVEEMKTKHGGIKFEFFATMVDGVELMGLGASCFGRC